MRLPSTNCVGHVQKSGVIADIGGGEHPAPFACAIGFRTDVFEGRLPYSLVDRSLHAGQKLEENANVGSIQRIRRARQICDT